MYELLDETLDYGYPQGTSTETLRNHVRNEPILVDSAKSLRLPSVRVFFVFGSRHPADQDFDSKGVIGVRFASDTCLVRGSFLWHAPCTVLSELCDFLLNGCHAFARLS